LSQAVGDLTGWQPGQVRRAVYHLPTRPSLTGRRVTVQVALLTATGQVTAEVDLTDLVLDSRERSFEQPAVQHPLEATLGQPPQVTLLGYDLAQADVAPGATLPLTLYWQAEAELGSNYTVFIQLLNPAQQVVAQVDRPPQAGQAPTTTWLPPEIVTDPYDLTLPENLPPGEYRLIAGLYDAATGLRLSVSGTADFVGITTIRVQ
jgi:hypothetical protein